MTADPVRPKETLRDRIAQALAALRISVHTAPWVEEWDGYVVRIELGRVNGETLADAVLPIVEEATKPLIEEIEEFAVELVNERAEHQALRDKVKALADTIDALYGLTVLGTRMAEISRELRALVEGPQGGEQ